MLTTHVRPDLPTEARTMTVSPEVSSEITSRSSAATSMLLTFPGSPSRLSNNQTPAATAMNKNSVSVMCRGAPQGFVNLPES